MKIQERIIKQSLISDTCDFPDLVNIEYFADDELKQIMIYIRNITNDNAPTLQLLRAYMLDINFNKRYANVLILRVENIVNDESLNFLHGDVNELLLDEYSNISMKKCQDVFSDNKFTIGQRVSRGIDILNKCYEDTSNKYEYSYKHKTKEYVFNYQNNIEDSYIKKSIKLEDENLALLFNDYIRPFMYSIAGRPNDYKSTIGINLVNHLLDLDKVGLYFSMEDSHETLRNKLLACKTMVGKENINRMNLAEYDKRIIAKASEDQKGELFIIDKLISRHDLRRLAIKYHRKHKIDFIVIDYLQKIILDNKKKHEEIGLFTQEILNIIKMFQIPVIAITQLNRDSGGGEPAMENIKDSGDIEQDSRVILALWSTNEQKEKGNSYRYIKHLKNTWGGYSYRKVEFEPLSGRLENVYNIERSEVKSDAKKGYSK